MSFTEEEAAEEAYFEQLTEEAIGDFTKRRLRSYYDENFTTMQPALRSLHEATRLQKNNHLTAAAVFAAAAVELFLKNTILEPLVYGFVHNENMAAVILDHTLGQTGFARYQKLLKDIFREVANINISTVKRNSAGKPLLEECTALSARRNALLHGGNTATPQEAKDALVVAEAVYSLLVAPMITALGLYIFADGVISPSEHSRPVRTLKNEKGIRIVAEPVHFPRERPTLAGTTIPIPLDLIL